MKFEIGKFYQHTTGHKLHVVSAGLTTMWGWTLIAESDSMGLCSLGGDEASAVNWSEICESDWMKSFSK
jgi:hypothetical protein